MSENCGDEPENIWLSPGCEQEREWCQHDVWEKCDECGRPSVRYIRADLHDATIAQQAAEIERLRADLEHAQSEARANEEAGRQAVAGAVAAIAERDTAQATLAKFRGIQAENEALLVSVSALKAALVTARREVVALWAECRPKAHERHSEMQRLGLKKQSATSNGNPAMTDNVTQFPTKQQPDLLVGPFTEWRVVVDGRVIPRLTGLKDGDKISLMVDSRFGATFSTEEDARQAAWLIAEAMAIGQGYSHLGAENKDQPFAPIAMQISS